MVHAEPWYVMWFNFCCVIDLSLLVSTCLKQVLDCCTQVKTGRDEVQTRLTKSRQDSFASFSALTFLSANMFAYTFGFLLVLRFWTWGIFNSCSADVVNICAFGYPAVLRPPYHTASFSAYPGLILDGSRTNQGQIWDQSRLEQIHSHQHGFFHKQGIRFKKARTILWTCLKKIPAEPEI